MTCVIAGEVLDVGPNSVQVRDVLTEDVYEILLQREEILKLDKGTHGFFVGELRYGKITARKVDIRKFLQPLHERDIMELSAKYIQVEIVDNPFDELYAEHILTERPLTSKEAQEAKIRESADAERLLDEAHERVVSGDM